MACQRTSRAVMTARFSQPSRISALEPNGWAWVTANPPSPSMRMWSPLVSWLVSLTPGRCDGVVAGGHDTGSLVRAGSGGMIREGMMTSAVSGSWRMMSMVTRWDHFLLRMTRASRA